MLKSVLLGSGSYGGVRKPAIVVFLAAGFAALLTLAGTSGTSWAAAQPSFGKSNLAGESSTRPTSLQYGPDGRLYVAQQNGTIKVYTVKRTGQNNYDVTATETINLIKNIQNHNDNGAPNDSENNRQVTGLVVTGTAAKPVIYVSSSDSRIGGNSAGTDTNLDTNSGIISRLTWNGSSWNKLDLVRGLPRSEENHSTNGLQLSADGKTLYAGQGGNTNKGAPSNNFANLPEYALSGAILSIDFGKIGNTTYDLPTIGTSPNQPLGGNNGLNQAKLVPGGPVQVYAPGFRNPYDLVIAKSGKMYTVDNGSNAGWGDIPKNEGPGGNCTNAINEPGTTDNDSLHYVSQAGYYGGHPNPTRGNMSNTFGGKSPVSSANPVECDFRNNGADKGELTTYPASTNGIAEYTATNFGGAMKGDLLTASFSNTIYRMQLNDSGTGMTSKQSLFSNVGSTPLDVTAEGDNDLFPGTIWAADIGSGDIVAFEPTDFGGGGGNSCDTSDPNGDADNDGYTNKDEATNGTDPCSSADVPSDHDKDHVSDLNDPDDDNDGIPDVKDNFALDPQNGKGTNLPVKYSFNRGSEPGTLLDVGFTGMMTNGTQDYQKMYTPGNIIAGGANPVLTVESVSNGDAYQVGNSQENGFQYGVNVDPNTGPFTAHTRILAPFAGMQPKNFQSMGLTIGPGDQDNYIKLTTAAAGGNGGIEFAKEVQASFKGRNKPSVPMPGPDAVDLFLTVDPAAKTVQPSYTVTTNGKESERKQLGGPEPIPASWVDGTDAVAVGLISTSFGAQSFPATWDFLNVTPENTAEPVSKAKVAITPNSNNINASSYNDGSFKVTNTSTNAKLDSVTLDLGTAILPDMIFDPEGKAGDDTAKKFTVDNEGGTGQSTNALFKPHNGTNGADGYDALKINFNDFDPGETFAFSIDVDPNSIKGTPRPGPQDSGSVSGLELTDSTITTAFDDGTTAKNKAFSDGSNAGSAAVVKTNSAAAPKLQVLGVSSAKATVSDSKQTVKVTGPKGAKVQLLRLEAGLFVPQNGGYNVEPYDANSAVALNKVPATIGSDGTVKIPVTLTRQTDPKAGLNHLVAVLQDGVGDKGLTSTVSVLNYDPSSAPPANTAPKVDPIDEQKGVEGKKFSLQVKASDPDQGDTLSYSAQGLPAGLSIDKNSGLISGTIGSGAVDKSPYTAKVTVSDGESNTTETFKMTVSKPTSPGKCTITGTEGDDTLRGTAGRDIICGLGGNDEIYGLGGNDDLRGGAGSDSLYGGPGEDVIRGQQGNDRLVDTSGENIMIGGDGTDKLFGGTDRDRLYGGNDKDYLLGRSGDDYANGGSGNDVVIGQEGDDRLVGKDGNDILRGGDNTDKLFGGSGSDNLIGQGGRDFLIGRSGDDYANGGSGNDVVIGQEGDDRLVGKDGNDILRGGDNTDKLFGGSGSDNLIGQGRKDFLYGRAGDDYANGGTGSDVIKGDEGDDRLVGKGGNDNVIGGEDNDTMFGGPNRDRLFGQGGKDRLIIRDGVRGNDYANGGPNRDRCAADPRDRVVRCP